MWLWVLSALVQRWATIQTSGTDTKPTSGPHHTHTTGTADSTCAPKPHQPQTEWTPDRARTALTRNQHQTHIKPTPNPEPVQTKPTQNPEKAQNEPTKNPERVHTKPTPGPEIVDRRRGRRSENPVTHVTPGSLELRCCAGSRPSPTLRQAPGPVGSAPRTGRGHEPSLTDGRTPRRKRGERDA